jgi:prephenate dehydrogenase
MKQSFVIAGLGLLGGSLALALKQSLPDCRIHALGRDPQRLRQACVDGFADSWSTDIQGIPDETDGAFVCTNVATIAEIATEILSRIADHAFVTDVGSTKAGIVSRVQASGLARGRFVGSHPMAGSEKSGCEFARADLFSNATIVLTPTVECQSELVLKVQDIWAVLGGRTILMSPEKHDAIVGMTSHLPHLLSYAYAAALGTQGDYQGVWGNGMRDFLRLARSTPELWSGILTENRAAVLDALDIFKDEISRLRQHIESNNQEALGRDLALCYTQTEELCAQNR